MILVWECLRLVWIVSSDVIGESVYGMVLAKPSTKLPLPQLHRGEPGPVGFLARRLPTLVWWLAALLLLAGDIHLHPSIFSLGHGGLGDT